MVQSLQRYCTVKNLFLFFLGLFSFSHMLGSRIRYISLLGLIFFGAIHLFKEQKFKITYLKSAFFIFVLASFTSSLYVEKDFSHFFSQNINIFLMFLLFIVVSSARLNENELTTYFIKPFLYAFLILFSIAMYKHFYVVTGFDRFRIIGSVNKGAIYMTFVFCVALSFIYYKDKKTSLLSQISALCAFMGILIAASRSAWAIILAILCLFYFLVLSKKWNIKYLIFSALTIIFLLFITYLANSELIINKFSNFFVEEYRGKIWLAAWDSYILNKNYLFGIGTGHFKTVSLSSYLPNWYDHIGQVHNMYLHFLVENGIVGLLAFIGILGIYLKKASLFYKNNLFFLCGILSSLNVILASLSQNSIQKELGFCFFLILSISLATMNNDLSKR